MARDFVLKHSTAAIVAATCVGLSLAGGAYSLKLIAGGGIVAWSIVILGLAFLGWPRGQVSAVGIAAACALVGLALLTVLSLSWASDDGRAFDEVVRVSSYLGAFVLVLLVARRKDVPQWIAGLTIGLAVVAGLALGSRLEPELFPTQELSRFLPAAQARLSYPLNYWNGLATCLAVTIVLLVWQGGHARSRITRTVATAALPVPGLALYLTSSRGGVLAMTAGLVAVLALPGRRLQIAAGLAAGGATTALLIALISQRHDLVDGLQTGSAATQGDEMLLWTLAAALTLAVTRYVLDASLQSVRIPVSAARRVAVVCALGAVTAIVALDPPRRIDEFSDPPAGVTATSRGFVSAHLTSGGGSGRSQLWDSALDAFASDRLKGVGAGGFEAWWTRHGSISYYVRDAHSLLFETMAELGFIGLTLVLGFLFLGLTAPLRFRSPRPPPEQTTAVFAVLLVGTVSMMIDWTWELPAALLPTLVAAALLTGPLVGSPAQGQGRFGWGVATILAGWAAICASALLLATTVLLSQSRENAGRGDLAGAVKAAREARTLEPWSAAPRLQLALVEERAGNLRAARGDAEAAASRSPDDWRAWLVLARLRVKAGDVAAARRALARVRILNPRSPIFGAG